MLNATRPTTKSASAATGSPNQQDCEEPNKPSAGDAAPIDAAFAETDSHFDVQMEERLDDAFTDSCTAMMLEERASKVDALPSVQANPGIMTWNQTSQGGRSKVLLLAMLLTAAASSAAAGAAAAGAHADATAAPTDSLTAAPTAAPTADALLTAAASSAAAGAAAAGHEVKPDALA